MKTIRIFHFFVAFYLLVTITGCDTKDDEVSELRAIELQGTLNEDQALLDALFTDIISIIEDVPCTNPEDWKITPIGYKACGGPVSFIAYPIEIEVDKFLNLVEVFRLSQKKFMEKWEIASDCRVPDQPIDVACENGLPILIY